MSKAIKNNLLIENSYIKDYKIFEEELGYEYYRSYSPYYYRYWDREKKYLYYLIDDVSVIELNE